MKLIRLYVSDSSEDNLTQEAIEPLIKHARGRLISRRASESFDSGETHLNDLLKVVEAEFVWTLADDEVLSRYCFDNLVVILKKHDPDILVVNPPLTTHSGRSIIYPNHVGRNLLADFEDKPTTYKEIVKRVGFIHLMAMMSAIISRKSLLTSKDWLPFLKDNPLYGRAMAQMAIFANRKAIITSEKIFCYRYGADDSNVQGVFLKLAEKRNVSFCYFFQASLLGFLVRCIEDGTLSKTDVIMIREVMWNQSVFLLLGFVTDNLIQRLVDVIQGKGTTASLAHPNEVATMQRFSGYLPCNMQPLFREILDITGQVREDQTEFSQRGSNPNLPLLIRLDHIHESIRLIYAEWTNSDQHITLAAIADRKSTSAAEKMLTRLIPRNYRRTVGELLCFVGMRQAGSYMYNCISDTELANRHFPTS